MKGVRVAGVGRKSKTPYGPSTAASLRQYFEHAAQAFDRQVGAFQFEGLCMPTIVGWCKSTGVPLGSIHGWRKRHQDFAEALTFARKIQSELQDLGCQMRVNFIYDTTSEDRRV